MATANIKGDYFRLWWENTVVQAYLRNTSSRIGEYKRSSGNFYVAETLVACDVSAIPPGSTVTAVTVTINITANALGSTQTLTLHKQDQGAWTDTGTAPVFNTFSTSTAWPAALSSLSILTSDSGSKTIPTSAALVSLVQGWVNGTGTAHDGLILGMDPNFFAWFITASVTSIDVTYTAPAANTSAPFLMFA